MRNAAIIAIWLYMDIILLIHLHDYMNRVCLILEMYTIRLDHMDICIPFHS